jgi:hypothetical protein
MLEKRLYAVPAQSFTADGTSNGVVTIAAEACQLFKVKQHVVISANSLTPLTLEVKRIDSEGNVQVGPIPNGKPGVNTSIDARTDISAYTVILGAAISAAEQKRPAIDYAEAMRAVYDEEPAVALRTIMVDECGNRINDNNPFPVAFDGTVSIGDVHIIGRSPDNNEMDVNSDGSINVNIVTSSDTPGLILNYNEITSVASGIETTIITVTSPPSGHRVEKIDVSGDNIGQYKVYVNGSPILTKRSWWTEFNQTFNFENFPNGLVLTSGQNLTVTITHSSPNLGSFEATVMTLTT